MPEALRKGLRSRGPRRPIAQLVPLLASLLLPGTLGCQTMLQHVGVALFYEHAPLPEAQTRLDLAYREGPDAHPDKHRLDLFLPDPATRGWPTLVFVHGGGWTEGDRAIEAGGVQPVRNIGRFFAARGVGTAVISYRLQPSVGWRDQLDDVAAATRWVHDHIAEYGGEPDALYLSGHSAGAWLAARVGYDPEMRARAGLAPGSLCGLALVSGAGYDLADEETYALGADRAYFVERFAGGDPDWETSASVVPLAVSTLPPTLILYAEGEPAKLKHQGDLLYRALQQAGASVDRTIVPGEDHQRILLTLSRGDRTSAPAMLKLFERAPCASHP